MTSTQRRERQAYCDGYDQGTQDRQHMSRNEASEAGHTTDMTQAEEDCWMNGHDAGVAGDRWVRDRCVNQTSMW